MVWTQVEQLLEDPTLIRAELERRRDEGLRTSPIKQRQQRVRQDLQRLSQQIDKLLDAYQEGLLGLGELRQRMPVLRKKQAAAQKELECAHWQALADEQLRQLDQSLETFLGRLKQSAQTLTVIDKQKIIRLLVKEIIVEKDAITVRHCIPLTGGVTHAEPMCEQLSGQINQPSYQVCLGSHFPNLGEPDLGRIGAASAGKVPQEEGAQSQGKLGAIRRRFHYHRCLERGAGK
jgi:site-specific DNA recombinase